MPDGYNTKHFANVVRICAQDSRSECAKGDKFEPVCMSAWNRSVWKSTPTYGGRTRNLAVADFSVRESMGGKDLDLVAQIMKPAAENSEKFQLGEFYAIEYKDCDRNSPLQKSDVDSLLSHGMRRFETSSEHIITYPPQKY